VNFNFIVCYLSEFVAVVVGAYVEGEIDGRDEAEGGTDEIGVGERGVLRDNATEDETDADADIPRGEIGGVGSATLIMLGKIDK
jgi:hypothetical protein